LFQTINPSINHSRKTILWSEDNIMMKDYRAIL